LATCLLEGELGWAEKDKITGKIRVLDRWGSSDIKQVKLLKVAYYLTLSNGF
jgi:hypothetical protein